MREDFACWHPCIDKAELTKFGRVLEQDIREIPEREIKGSGFLTMENYREGALAAVNDTDTTGATTGALAGLYYGYEATPKSGKRLVTREKIERIAGKMPCWRGKAR